MAGDSNPGPRATFRLQLSDLDLPWAEISLVTVDPNEIPAPDKNHAQATVSVQIFHTPLKSKQALSLAVGTFRTDPQVGVSVSYDPPSQTIDLPPSPQGKIDAKVKVSKPNIGTNKQATVVVVASIKPVSPGIRIENDDPGLPNHQATLTIQNK
jgi:hypothetical protein